MRVTKQLEVGDLSFYLADHVQILDSLTVKNFNSNFCACENVFSIWKRRIYIVSNQYNLNLVKICIHTFNSLFMLLNANMNNLGSSSHALNSSAYCSLYNTQCHSAKQKLLYEILERFVCDFHENSDIKFLDFIRMTIF